MVPARTNTTSVKRKVPTIRLKDDADLKVRKDFVPSSCTVVEESLEKGAHPVVAAELLMHTRGGSNFTFLLNSLLSLGNLTVFFAKSKAASAQSCMNTDNNQVN